MLQTLNEEDYSGPIRKYRCNVIFVVGAGPCAGPDLFRSSRPQECLAHFLDMNEGRHRDRPLHPSDCICVLFNSKLKSFFKFLYYILAIQKMVFFREGQRKQLRLTDYDYRNAGFYYVTLCTQNRFCLFGDVKDGCMILNDAGLMIQNVWLAIPDKYSGFQNDLFTIMPNHLHAILIIREKELGPARGPAPTLSLPDVMRNFKSLTTHLYTKGIEENKFQPFEKSLWQRSYYEHIIRNDQSLERIRQYIIDNPKSWDEDKENPKYLL